MPGDIAPRWPPVWGLVHPGPPDSEIRLDPVTRWRNPLARHPASGYRKALEKIA